MKFKMIIWDWNGTLLNDVDYNVTAVNQMLLKQNKPLINREHIGRYLHFQYLISTNNWD
jgi:beta-phosphoglucomutase-like phosphatase (HAD superfamily)